MSVTHLVGTKSNRKRNRFFFHIKMIVVVYTCVAENAILPKYCPCSFGPNESVLNVNLSVSSCSSFRSLAVSTGVRFFFFFFCATFLFLFFLFLFYKLFLCNYLFFFFFLFFLLKKTNNLFIPILTTTLQVQKCVIK